MPQDSRESPDAKAIRLLNKQLDELQTIRSLNYRDPKFNAWHDTTMEYLARFLGKDSQHYHRFRNLSFVTPRIVPAFDMWGGSGPIDEDYISPEDQRDFKEACETADASLSAAIRHVEEFGVHVEEVRPPAATRGRGRSRSLSGAGDDPHGSSGVSQTFHGPVTIHNQAIATDNAIQKIERMGDATGTSLREIAGLLQQSMEITRRQLEEGLAGIEGLAVEAQKPEASRNWRAVLGYGQKVLDIAAKATDLAQKLAPYTPAVITLMDKARHALG